MPFYIRVPSLITPVHCITQTEEPNFWKIRRLRGQEWEFKRNKIDIQLVSHPKI
jgi:hypothetical protein